MPLMPGSWMSIKMSAGCRSCEAHALFAGLSLDGLITLDLQRIPHQLQVLGVVVFDDENELIRHDAPGS
jgi:hypothetical protein